MPVVYSLKREAAMGILWTEAGSPPTEDHHIVLLSTAILHGRAVFFCVRISIYLWINTENRIAL